VHVRVLRLREHEVHRQPVVSHQRARRPEHLRQLAERAIRGHVSVSKRTHQLEVVSSHRAPPYGVPQNPAKVRDETAYVVDVQRAAKALHLGQTLRIDTEIAHDPGEHTRRAQFRTIPPAAVPPSHLLRHELVSAQSSIQ
jgi:hypothetical protein